MYEMGYTEMGCGEETYWENFEKSEWDAARIGQDAVFETSNVCRVPA
jgi:hypothetical protein